MQSLAPAIKALAANIKLVVFDVDGVLTDGTLTYSATGEEVKHFNVKDGVGIKLLQTYGIHTAIISAKDSLPLKRRAQDLGDRKSTRLNSSHVRISYAVFCLKKK